jgi:2-polyprenyl-3-methyl-5-hydroxy-6-metoxy-1,4-benzoquinol methylase
MYQLLHCPKCKTPLTKVENGFLCQECSNSYSLIDDIPSFVDQNETIESFDPTDFHSLYEMEQKHFWHVGRKEIILQVLKRHVPDISGIRMLEIGSGNGNVMQHLLQNGINITGGDIFLEGLNYCRRRNSTVSLYQIDILSLPFNNSYDVIGAFDVLEHIEDDIRALKEINVALKSGGVLILTVPANKFLWSYFDRRSSHWRRYSKQELIAKIEQAGFTVKKVSFYMFFLFPVFAAMRLLKNMFVSKTYKKANDNNSLEAKTIPVINDIFLALLNVEEHIIRYTNLPFGASLIALGVKRDEE